MSTAHGRLAGRIYLERGEPVLIEKSWGPGKGPRNVLIQRADGSLVVRPFRGLRKWPETWRVCPQHEGYEVSNEGKVRNRKTGRRLKPTLMPRGYLKVNLGRSCRDQYVHTLVLTAFDGPRPRGYEGDHYDFNRLNNRLDNLRWMKKSDNAWRWEVYAQEEPEPLPYSRDDLLRMVAHLPVPNVLTPSTTTERQAA